MNKIIAKDCKYRTYDKYLGDCCLKGLANDTDDLDQCDFCNINWEEQILENHERRTKVNNNFIKLKGIVHTQPKFSHTTHGENFLEFTLEVKRKSEVSDLLPITISERLIKCNQGEFLEILGEVRTFNKFENEKSRLIITVFAKEVRVLECEEYENSVELNGFICKPVTSRTTPLSDRKIADVLIAVNGRNNRVAYIPSIAWNKDSVWLAEQPVGTELNIAGRLQSRNYQKNFDGQIEERTAIELCIKSVNKIEKGE